MTSATGSVKAPLSFSSHEHFRHRLVLSILSGRPVRIDKIRPTDANPGLRGPSMFGRIETLLTSRIDYEVSLLRLLERVTNGTVIEISVTGVFTRTVNPVLPLRCFFEQRYRNPTPTWDHSRRSSHPRVPFISFNRLLLGARHYDRPVLQKAFGPYTQRRHHR